MKQFANLFMQLDQTNKTNTKVAALVDYFDKAPDEEKVWAIAIMSHRRPKRPVSTRDLREWCQEETGLPEWLFDETYHVVGDLAETIAKLLPKVENTEDRGLLYWVNFLIELRGKPQEEKKKQILAAWRELETFERFVFNKLITGGFRMGVSQKLMTRALSQHLDKDPAEMAHRLMGNWDPAAVTFYDLLLDDSVEADTSKPYPFFLAYQLEDGPESLGSPHDWFAEYKWDGIRGQLIFRNGEVFLWSRGEELVTDQYPELKEVVELLPEGTVLDGEVLVYKDGQIQGFSLLQKRIGRKTVGAKMLKDAPVVLRCYDILEWEGRDLRHETQEFRREILERVFTGLPDNNLLQLSELINFNSWEELIALREDARSQYSEGLMLKAKKGTYGVGRKKGDWWKWKVDALTIDAVMIYAMRGHGRRANLYTDYTFAVWDGDKLVPFAKAYSGLTDEEFNKVDSFVKRNTLERFGPVRSVKPELVFEIAFEGIQKSTRHKSGIALRFPRMKRWRKDKPSKEANTLADLQEMLRLYG
ncbi:ATP-dependent DNA ligase [Owenweeksia hongkongensis DSM 17368]|uniref:DNA ligase (ATP) n=1 Tax=Owenweeksia hongkongensis (strain DSM 17368 / CIP 108786 / JCM 12287 / NRRL B-23963 / UST20020801) TaxID=926562 RepID=G8R709_OWEHD|nr:ATP-dependent DNA ligase [Owenweeksia hongkongensis]AEV33374.1 ATP-dependent DNA ligase [Owenweeksia hongkongensis DSM 17368]